MPARIFPANPKLQIFTDEGQAEGQNEKLKPTSSRYQEVERCIQMALVMLERPAGRSSPTDTAQDIITKRRGLKKPSLYTGDFSDLSHWIDVFLRCMRGDFPMTYLAHMEGEAMAVRQANDMTAMSSFSPKHMGYMDVNRYIINNIISALARKDDRTATLFRFQMVISLAHEIVHFLTGFLTGDKADKLGTPPKTTAGGYGSNIRGEAGRFWEQLLLGGQLEMWEDKANKLEIIQAGEPYLMEGGGGKSVARLVNYGYIEQFVVGTRKFPMRTEGTRGLTTRGALQANRKEMSDVRSKKYRSAPPADSPPPGPGAANRMIPKPVRTVMKGIYMTVVPS